MSTPKFEIGQRAMAHNGASETDRWTQEEFEDEISNAMIACFETKLIKQKGAGPDRLRVEHLRAIRRQPLFIPGRDRIFQVQNSEDGRLQIDLDLDRHPKAWTTALEADSNSVQWPGLYVKIIRYEPVLALPKNWHRDGGGRLYQVVRMNGMSRGVSGERFFVSVDRAGVVSPCRVRVRQTRIGEPGKPEVMLCQPESEVQDHVFTAYIMMQIAADARHCWKIRAREGSIAVRVGCGREEIKSLLYARTLPMTATGRKRPILHLVAAHQRRLKNGTDVDVSSFLRGTQNVIIGGTEFAAQPPPTLSPHVSTNSQRYFNSELEEA